MMVNNTGTGILLQNVTPTAPFNLSEFCEPAKNEPPVHSAVKYVMFSMLAFLSVTGVTGNALVFIVYWRKKDHQSDQTSTLFILTLALTDFFTCLVNVPFTLVMEFLNYNIGNDVSCKLYHFLITSSVPFSAFLMAAIAVDRYLCICHPFKHIMNKRRAKIVMAVLGIIAAAAGIIVALNYGVYQKGLLCPTDNTGANENGTKVTEPTYFWTTRLSEVEDPTFLKQIQEETQIHYRGLCSSNTIILPSSVRTTYKYFHLGMYIASLAVVVILYGLLYQSVIDRRRRRQRQRFSVALPNSNGSVHGQTDETELNTIVHKVNQNGESQEMIPKPQSGTTEQRKLMEKANRKANLKTAAMLFVVAVVFIISFLPCMLIVSQIITYKMLAGNFGDEFGTTVAKILFYFYFINHVANPVIYSFMNQNFREDLRKLLNCK